MFVRALIRFLLLRQSFALSFFQMGISQHPLIRNHSYVCHGYIGGSAYIIFILTLGFTPRGGARGQNLP